MNRISIRALLLVLILCGGGWIWYMHHNDPRRAALRTLSELNAALETGNSQSLAKIVILPIALQNRTDSEKTEFMIKSLQNEISPEGLRVLSKAGTFGSLTNLFPTESIQWGKSAGVSPGDCLAFRMETGGLRAEVVLAPAAGKTYRVIRCNNVSQLAVQNQKSP
jgi:hypothetical protein